MILRLQVGEGRVQLLELLEVVEGGLHQLIDDGLGHLGEVTMVAITP
jgi:hypothetical protein